MPTYLLGIDYGTGGAKACIIDTIGTVRGYAFEEYPFVHERPGWSEHPPQVYWPIACRLIRSCIEQASIAPAEIKGIAVSSALPSMVMVDRDGNPIERAYNLMDRRATREVEWLKAEIGEERILQVTANRLDDHPTLVNLLWEKNNRPASFNRIWKALTIDGYITLKLTGEATLNYSAGAFYGVAYNVLEHCFDQALLDRIGISEELMPILCRCDSIAGTVTRKAAEETGLAAGTPVAGGSVDCNAGFVGGGATEPGDIQSNLGSAGVFGIVHRKPEFMFSPVGITMINFAYTVDCEETYIAVGTTTTGGQSLRYLRDNFGQLEQETERLTGISSYDLMNLEAEKAPPGADGLIILPFLMGERTPIWDVHARGVVFGLSLNHTKGHLVRAMMEGVAYAMYDSFRLVEESGIHYNLPLVLNEGGAKSRIWRQIIADVFGVPVTLVKRRTGAPFGDAILGGVATGVFKDFSVAKQWVEYVEPAEPNAGNHDRYMAYFSLFKQLYENVKNDFRTLAQLRER